MPRSLEEYLALDSGGMGGSTGIRSTEEYLSMDEAAPEEDRGLLGAIVDATKPVTLPLKAILGVTGGAVPKLLEGLAPEAYEAARRTNEAELGVEGDPGLMEAAAAAPGLGDLAAAVAGNEGLLGTIANNPIARIIGNAAGDPTTYMGGVGAIPKVAQIGKALKGGRFLEAAKGAAVLPTIIPRSPGAGVAYGPELVESSVNAMDETIQRAQAGEWGEAALSGANSILALGLANLVRKGVIKDIQAKHTFVSKVGSPQQANDELLADTGIQVDEILDETGAPMDAPMQVDNILDEHGDEVFDMGAVGGREVDPRIQETAFAEDLEPTYPIERAPETQPSDALVGDDFILEERRMAQRRSAEKEARGGRRADDPISALPIDPEEEAAFAQRMQESKDEAYAEEPELLLSTREPYEAPDLDADGPAAERARMMSRLQELTQQVSEAKDVASIDAIKQKLVQVTEELQQPPVKKPAKGKGYKRGAAIELEPREQLDELAEEPDFAQRMGDLKKDLTGRTQPIDPAEVEAAIQKRQLEAERGRTQPIDVAEVNRRVAEGEEESDLEKQLKASLAYGKRPLKDVEGGKYGKTLPFPPGGVRGGAPLDDAEPLRPEHQELLNGLKKGKKSFSLVEKIARGYKNSSTAHSLGMTEDDLIGVANVTLMDAAKKYDPGMGVPFEHYARRAVSNAMNEKLRKGYADKQTLISETSARDDEAIPVLDKLKGPEALEPDAELKAREAPKEFELDERAAMAKARAEGLFEEAKLNTREKDILHEYFVNDKTLAEIGEKYGVSKTAIEKVKNAAIEKMKGTREGQELGVQGPAKRVQKTGEGELVGKSWQEAKLPAEPAAEDHDRVRDILRELVRANNRDAIRKYGARVGMGQKFLTRSDGLEKLANSVLSQLGINRIEFKKAAVPMAAPPAPKQLVAVKEAGVFKGLMRASSESGRAEVREMGTGKSKIYTLEGVHGEQQGAMEKLIVAIGGDDPNAHMLRVDTELTVPEGGLSRKTLTKLESAGLLTKIRESKDGRFVFYHAQKPSATASIFGAGQLKGLKPEVAKNAVKAGLELFEGGLRDSAKWSKAIVARIGPEVKPHLRKLYNSIAEVAKTKDHSPKVEREEALLKELGVRPFTPKEIAPPVKEGVMKEVLRTLSEIPEDAPVIFGPKGSKAVAKATKAAQIEHRDSALNSMWVALPDTTKKRLLPYYEALNSDLDRAKKVKWADIEEPVRRFIEEHSMEEHVRRFKDQGGVFTDVEVQALRKIVNEGHLEEDRLRAKYLESVLHGDGPEQEAAFNAIARQAQETVMAATVLFNSKTRIARALAINRNMVGGIHEEETTFGRLRSSLRQMGVPKNAIEELSEKLKAGDIKGFTQGLHLATDPTLGDKALEFWKSGLLGWPSLLANTGSNALFRGLREVENKALGGVDAVRHQLGIGPNKRLFVNMPHNVSKVATKMAWATAGPQFIQELKGAFKLEPLGVRTDMGPDFADVQRMGGAIGGKLGELVRFQFKALDATDQFFKIWSYYRGLFQHAHTSGVNAGLKGNELMEHILGMVDRAKSGLDPRNVDEYLEFKSLNEELVENANRDTFKAPLTGAFRSLGMITQQHKWTQAIVPFYKTPSNIAIEAGRRTPFALLKKTYDAIQAHKTGKGKDGKDLTDKDLRELMDGMVKPLISSALGLGITMAAAEGLVTGGGPVDRKKETALRRTGWQPYSFKIGDQYISYQRFEPISSILGIAADAGEALSKGELDNFSNTFKKLHASIIHNFTSKTFLSGIEAFFMAWADPQQYGPRWIKQLEGSAIPTNVGFVPVGGLARAIDPVYRKTEAADISPLVARVPGLSKTLEPQRIPTGEERKRFGAEGALGFVERLLSPVYREGVRKDDIAQLSKVMHDTGYVPGLPREYTEIGGKRVKLSQREHEMLISATQKATKMAVRVAKDPSFLRLPVNELDPKFQIGMKTQKDVLERIYREARREVMPRITAGALKRIDADVAEFIQ